jgi:transmembrane sensor
MLNSEEKEKIERYTKGLSDNTEKSVVESMFLNGENNEHLKHFLNLDWHLMLKDSSNTNTDIELDHLLDHVHHIISITETLKKKKPVQKVFSIYKRVAAILVLPLLIAGGLYYGFLGTHLKPTNGQQVSCNIYAPLGSRVSFNLPDGSTGVLNSGSKLTYSIPFTNKRNVKLEGEAWFEVRHDTKHPFEIRTCKSIVKVLGTSFNISSYPDENYVEVVLKQGKVEFQDNISDEKITLLPSERLVFKNGTVRKSSADPAKYNAWTEGKLVFRDDPMAEVVRRIERWYNVKIVLADKAIEKYSFRATFEDDKLEEVLRLLSMTSPITYHIAPRKLLEDGTYEKEEITINIKK